MDMDEKSIRALLAAVKDGVLDLDSAMERLRRLPCEDMGFACVDHHRFLRTGMPEVVFGEGKSAGQIVAIMKSLAAEGTVALATRVDAEKAETVLAGLDGAVYHADARIVQVNGGGEPASDSGVVLVAAAGTSDLPVAEEAAVTARAFGCRVETVYDVGVAGVHRLLSRRRELERAAVVIAVAGMEGALPGVIAGLVEAPVIAVPTSVGYGSGAGGFAALLSMLNSCAPGMAVVNIDNGFGAASMAAAVMRAAARLAGTELATEMPR